MTNASARSRACKHPSIWFKATQPWAPSLAEYGLDLGIQRLPLCCLATNRAKPSNLELLASPLGRIRPLLQSTLREILLAGCRCGFAHDLAALVLRQFVLGQAARSLHPLTTEN